MTAAPFDPARSARRIAYGGGLVVGLLFFSFAAWAAVATLAGAIIATGTVVVDTNSRPVQHQDGGIVQDLAVRNGDRVTAGQTLIRLDDTLTRANLLIVERSLVDHAVREGRLRAEIVGEERLAPRHALALGTGALRPDLEDQRRAVLDSEQALLTARLTSHRARLSQLSERRDQFQQVLVGLDAQTSAKEQELVLIERELVAVRGLHERGHAPLNRVVALEREKTRIAGERGQLIAEQGRVRGQMTELGVQIAELDERFRSEALGELRQVEARIAELEERRIAAADRLTRVEIRAPIGGTVHESQVHTIGGVIQAAQTLMLIVPEGEALLGEVQVATTDIDQVVPGTPVLVRLPAFNQRTTPEFSGVVDRVSPDLVQDQRSGIVYYRARIRFGAEAFVGRTLVPGMPIEAYVRTAERTVASYLFKPLTDTMARMFREE